MSNCRLRPRSTWGNAQTTDDARMAGRGEKRLGRLERARNKSLVSKRLKGKGSDGRHCCRSRAHLTLPRDDR